MVNKSQSQENLEEAWVAKTKEHTFELAKIAGQSCEHLFRHLPEVEKWANRILLLEPNANKTIVMLGVWCHDVGKAVGDKDVDHAIRSETETIKFLQEIEVPDSIIKEVAHCARAHRCADVQPHTLEAKIVAAADSASHFTDIAYIDIARKGNLEEAKAKLERDFRDVSLLPKLQEDLRPMYLAWKSLLETYPKSI